MKWYAIQCHANKEYRALEHLMQQYNTVYLPEKPVDLRSQRRIKRDTEPLFPGYVFIRLSKENDRWWPIRNTRGVIGLVKFGQTIPHIPDECIADFVKYEQVFKTDYETGDQVLFNSDSFLNVPAIVQMNGADRVQILMTIMGTQRLIDVKRTQITPQEVNE